MQKDTAVRRYPFLYCLLLSRRLSEQAQYVLRCLICLCQHCSSSLGQNLVFCKLDHLFCHISITDTAFRSLKVFSTDIEAGNCLFKAVLICAEVCALFIDLFQSFIKSTDSAV